MDPTEEMYKARERVEQLESELEKAHQSCEAEILLRALYDALVNVEQARMSGSPFAFMKPVAARDATMREVAVYLAQDDRKVKPQWRPKP